MGLRIGIVRARFNDALTSKLAEACLAELARLEVEPSDIRHVLVPGALEVPVALKVMADMQGSSKKKAFDKKVHGRA